MVLLLGSFHGDLHIDLKEVAQMGPNVCRRDNWQERKWERPQHPNSMVTSFSLIEHLGRAPTSHENLRRILSGKPTKSHSLSSFSTPKMTICSFFLPFSKIHDTLRKTCVAQLQPFCAPEWTIQIDNWEKWKYEASIM